MTKRREWNHDGHDEDEGEEVLLGDEEEDILDGEGDEENVLDDLGIFSDDSALTIFGLRPSTLVHAEPDELEVADLEVLGGPNLLPSASVEQMLTAIEREICQGNYPADIADDYRTFHEILCDIADERIAADFLREVIGRGAFPL